MRQCVLLITPRPELQSAFQQMLCTDYEVLTVPDGAPGLALLERRRGEIAAVLIDVDLARAKGFADVSRLRGSLSFSSIPVLGILNHHPRSEDTDGLAAGLYDLLTPLIPRELVLQHISNAIRAKDSVSFHQIENILRQLPSNITLKDDKARYVFATHRWHHMEGSDDPSWTVRGKTDLELRKDKEKGREALESDRRILRSGVGETYIIEEHSDNVREYLELIKRPVFDEEGRVTGIVSLINDVTEQQLLKLELEKRSRMDVLTELTNKHTTEELIRMMLERFHNQGEYDALLMLDVDNFKQINDRFGHTVGDWVLGEIGGIIRGSFREIDVTGRVGGDEFMVFLQNICAPAMALEAAERVRRRVEAVFAESKVCGCVTLSAGVAICPDHGRHFEELYKHADEALYEVKQSGKNAVKLYTA